MFQQAYAPPPQAILQWNKTWNTSPNKLDEVGFQGKIAVISIFPSIILIRQNKKQPHWILTSLRGDQRTLLYKVATRESWANLRPSNDLQDLWVLEQTVDSFPTHFSLISLPPRFGNLDLCKRGLPQNAIYPPIKTLLDGDAKCSETSECM